MFCKRTDTQKHGKMLNRDNFFLKIVNISPTSDIDIRKLKIESGAALICNLISIFGWVVHCFFPWATWLSFYLKLVAR